MTPERFQQIDKLLDLALEREPSERARFLDEACDGDEALRTKLESLLRSHEQARDFLAEPPSDLANEILAARERERAVEECGLDWPEGASKVLGRYVVTEKLGGGGMGVVYAAHDPELDRKIAIKLMLPLLSDFGSASEGRARLLREAQAMARLSHPNVIAVHDVGTFGEQVFIAMEYVEGSTLSQWFAERKRTWHEVLSIFKQAGRGLAAAHAAGIVHRDFKPDNVLVGDDGRIRVLDFGLARPAQPSNSEELHKAEGQALADTKTTPALAMLGVTVTQRGKFIGTPAFMAPEQLMGERVNEKTDQYSFCVALFQGLYGALPFIADNFGALLQQIRQRKINEVPNSNSVPSSVHQALLRGLSPDPADRFSSMDDLLDKLEQQQAAPRRQTLIVAGLVIAVGLLLATGGWWGLRTRSSKQGVDEDRSIAVLPFASLSIGEENAYFARGFHDELLRQLGRIGDLRVISRTSVLQYKEENKRNLRKIAEALGVSSIVEGSVQRAGNRVRVEATLIDARSDRQLWGDRYDRDVTDVFGIQTAVAEEIAGALQARLSAVQKAQIARKPTQSAEAYDLYLRALEYANRPSRNQDDLAFAERFYRQAIQADPSFALARARLAHVMLHTYWFVGGKPVRVAEEARAQAEESLRRQPDLPDGHLALALYQMWRRLDYDRALKEIEIARPGLPAEAINLMGAVARHRGKFDEAIRNQEEAVRLDPRSPGVLRDLAYTLLWARRYEEADRVLDRALAIAPDFTTASIMKALVHRTWKGDTDLAKAVLRANRGRFPQWAISGLLGSLPREALAVLDSVESEFFAGTHPVYPKAYLYAVAHEALGDSAQARKEYEMALPLLQVEVHKNPDDGRQLSVLAHSYAGLGRKEDALHDARRAVELLPISKDALSGTEIEVERALVEARVGEKDSAIEHIRYLLSIPGFLSPALLRIDPDWASLRDDPRFRKLAELDHQ